MKLKITLLPQTRVAWVAVALLAAEAIALGVAPFYGPTLFVAALLACPLGPLGLLVAVWLGRLHSFPLGVVGTVVALASFIANFYFIAWVLVSIARRWRRPPSVTAPLPGAVPNVPSPSSAPQGNDSPGKSNAQDKAA